MTERKTVKVSKKSLHGRIYNYWLMHPRSKGYKWRPSHEWHTENLCHFVRVLLWWAPGTFLAYAKPKKHLTWLRPWMPMTLIATTISLILGFTYAPKKTWEFLLGIVLLSGGLFAFIGLILLAEFLHDRHLEKGDGFGTVMKEYVKAKKGRVCPFIEVMEDSKEPAK